MAGKFCNISYRCLVAVILLTAARGAAGRALDTFSYSSQEVAEQAWRPSPLSPPVVAAPAGQTGLTFPCPFGHEEVPRVYWDRTMSLDLSRTRTLQIDLSCDNPQAIRSFNVYLESGNGWYVCSTPLTEPGRQRLMLLKTAFSAEGRPAGWHRIRRVRISAWQGAQEDTSLTLYGLDTGGDSILLVRNTLSSDSPAERSFAAKIVQRLSRWLKDMNIAHGIVTDDEVIAGGLSPPGAGQAGARVAILAYNPHPPPKELGALKRFVAGGGKLIVFYGADPGLAELMHVRLGSYKRSEVPGVWDSFSFTAPEDWQVPERVYQKSFNIMPAFPADRSARVIAWWENAQGRRTDDPAWLASDRGLWMTHVLLDDNEQNKRLLLMGLLGQYEPSVWPGAARACLDRVGKIDSFKDFDEARSAILLGAAGSAEPQRVEELVQQADAAYRKVLLLYQEQRYRDVMAQCQELRAMLTEAYGRVQRPEAGPDRREFRAVWEHDGTGWYPGDWDRTCGILAENGITAVFPNMIWGAKAHYPSKVLAPSFTVKNFGDQLDQCIKAAHDRGLQVHAWAICWNLNGMPADFMKQLQDQGRLQMTATGRRLPWLCPSHPQNVALLLNGLKELVGKYPVDGVHLDYIRFAGDEACYCSTCRAAFEKGLGQRLFRWPGTVQAGGRRAADFRKWRAGQITSFVRRASEELRALRPGLKMSAAVWGNYPGCVSGVGQDWALWLEKGYLDFVCPMNYTADVPRFTSLARAQLALPGAAGKVFPGIGVTAAESQLQPDQVIEQIVALRRLGAPGFALFDLSDTLREETLPALRWCLTGTTP